MRFSMGKCKQCGKKVLLYTNNQSYITLNYSRDFYEGHGKSKINFCDAECAITFLEQTENRQMLVWVPKENLVSQFENECLHCLRNNKDINNPGPYLSIGGGCDTWYDDGCGPEYFCSVEHLIESLRLQQTTFETERQQRGTLKKS